MGMRAYGPATGECNGGISFDYICFGGYFSCHGAFEGVMKVYFGPYRKNRSVRVKIHPYDTWSLYSTLADIILPALKEFRKQPHGAPILDGFFDEKTGKTKPGLFKAWDKIIDKMILSFELIVKEDDMDRLYTSEEENQIKEGLQLFAEYYRCLWN